MRRWTEQCKLSQPVADGGTLAVEHTIIKPFTAEKEDFAFFSKAFPSKAFPEIEKDVSLVVPQRWIEVLIPVGILRGQRKPAGREAMVQGIHQWLCANRLNLRISEASGSCRDLLMGFNALCCQRDSILGLDFR